jgi:anti-sigma B factor antagonist
MELKISKIKEIYIIDIIGELDLYNSYKLKDLLIKMIKKNIKNFIIDLKNAEYIDSSGIGTLIFFSSTIKKLNLKLAIINVQGTVKKVIELTSLKGLFPISMNIKEAIEKFKD